MADFGIEMVSADTSVGEASASQVLFSTKNPFAKLDTTNLVSFQNINLAFKTDPTNNATTTVYSFAHGYKYVPTIWTLFQRTQGAGDQSGAQPNRISQYQYEGGIICVASGSGTAGSAQLKVNADTQNVYIKVNKQTGFLGDTVNLVGYTLLIRTYVFVEDIGAS